MFGIGPTELIIILVIALLVLGPKRLPELAAGLGKGLAEFRRATADINAEREAARAAQPERRVSRTQRVTPKSAETAASGDPLPETAEAEDDETDPKAPA